MIAEIEDLSVCQANETSPTGSPKTGDLIQLAPSLLTIHPALSPFPRLSENDAKLLREDIQKTGRVLQPILADSQLRVFDGRHRVELALELRLESVPVLIDDASDPVGAALASCLARRQLTKSGIALTLFEAHPELVEQRGLRKKANLARGKRLSKAEDFDKVELPSFQSLAEKYRFPKKYFSYLASMWESTTEEEWQKLRGVVLSGDCGLEAAYAGLRSKLLFKPRKHTPADDFELVLGGINTIGQRINRWQKLTQTEKDEANKQFLEMALAGPKEFWGPNLQRLQEAMGGAQ